MFSSAVGTFNTNGSFIGVGLKSLLAYVDSGGAIRASNRASFGFRSGKSFEAINFEPARAVQKTE